MLACKGGDGPLCLTPAQVTAAKKVYSPAVNPRTGKELCSSLVPGTELGWGVQAQGPDPSVNIYDQYRYVVFKDPNWDWKTFNFDTDVARGGKLLLYHGWSDPNVPTLNTIKYYKSVVEVMGGVSKASDSVRLFPQPWNGALWRR